jgi:hypothetical protein
VIINAQKLMPTFACHKLLANYLIYEKNLSVLDVDNDYYYFNDNDLIREILSNLPLWLKILNKF